MDHLAGRRGIGIDVGVAVRLHADDFARRVLERRLAVAGGATPATAEQLVAAAG